MMREKGYAFVTESGLSLPVQPSVVPRKPTVLILAHHKLFVDTIAAHPAFCEVMTVRPLIRETGFLNPFNEKDVDVAMQGVDLLVVSPMSHSMCPDRKVSRTERYAVRTAVRRSMKIGLLAIHRDCSLPPYLLEASAHVFAIATLDETQDAELHRHYHFASISHLHKVAESERKLHAIHKREAQRARLPENIREFGIILKKLC